MPCHVDVADSCYATSALPWSLCCWQGQICRTRSAEENDGIGRRSKCGLQMQISSPTCSAKQTFLYFTDAYIRSILGDKVSVPHTSRAKLCMRELNRIRLHTPSLTRGAVAPFCSVNLSPPLPVRSFSRFPLSHPNSNCARSESKCDSAPNFTTGRQRIQLQSLSQLLSNPASSCVEVISKMFCCSADRSLQ